MKRTLLKKISLFKVLPLTAAAIFSTMGLYAQGDTETQKETAFGDGEKLTYVVSYRATLVPNIEAGEVVLRTTKTTLAGTPVWNVYGNAKVFSSFKWFYDLDDTYQVWLDASTLRPVKYSFRLREGKYKANCDYTYNWNTKKVTTVFHNLRKPEPVTTVMSVSDKKTDPLALFYNLRSEDLSKYVQGKGNTLNIVLDDTTRAVTFTYLGKEQRNIKKLGKFDTLKFSCTIATSSGESFDDGSVFYLWITDDKNKIPVYLESPIKVGSVRVTLTKYQNLAHPLTSKK